MLNKNKIKKTEKKTEKKLKKTEKKQKNKNKKKIGSFKIFFFFSKCARISSSIYMCFIFQGK
jgi:hypothetical protein